MYSLRREAEADLPGILAQLPGFGFSGVELANPHGWEGLRWREELDTVGLEVAGAHVIIERMEAEWEDVLAFQKALKNPLLVAPIPPNGCEGEAGYRDAAQRLNRLGERISGEGMRLAYHNHEWEFAPFGPGQSCGMDILLAETDPRWVHFEVDTAWATYGGWDVVRMLREHSERVELIHAKEVTVADKSEPAMGEGDVDFPAVVALAKENDWPFVVEYESEPAPEGVAHSAAYLKHLLESA